MLMCMELMLTAVNLARSPSPANRHGRPGGARVPDLVVRRGRDRHCIPIVLLLVRASARWKPTLSDLKG